MDAVIATEAGNPGATKLESEEELDLNTRGMFSLTLYDSFISP